jgi:hypothetical protein
VAVVTVTLQGVGLSAGVCLVFGFCSAFALWLFPAHAVLDNIFYSLRFRNVRSYLLNGVTLHSVLE